MSRLVRLGASHGCVHSWRARCLCPCAQAFESVLSRQGATCTMWRGSLALPGGRSAPVAIKAMSMDLADPDDPLLVRSWGW